MGKYRQEWKRHILKHIIIFIGIGMMPFLAFSQNQTKADSLIKILNSKPVDSLINKVLYGIVRYHTNQDSTILYSNQLIKRASLDSQYLYMFRGYLNLGHAYLRKGNQNQALSSYFSAEKNARKLGRMSSVGASYVAIADVYGLSKNHQNSISYYNKAIKILRTPTDSVTLASALHNAGAEYSLHNKLDTALLYFEESKEIFHRQNYELGTAYNLGSIGLVYAKQGKNDIAESKMNEAITMLEKLNDRYPIASFYTTMSDIYKKRGNLLTALHYAENSLQIAEEEGFKEQISSASFTLSELYKSAGDKAKAYDFLNQHLIYRDSINNEETIRKMANLTIEFEVSQKQAEVDLLNERNRNNQIILQGIGLVLVLVVIISLIIYRASIINKRLSVLNKKQADRLKQLDEAKSRFFANISHDLRSPLTLIMGGLDQVLKDEEVYLTHKASRNLKIAQLNSERIIHMTNEINELIQLEEGKLILHKKYVNIDEMLSLFVKMFGSIVEQNNINLSYSKAAFEGHPILHIDPQQFEKVLFNLITNAIKHSTNGDDVCLSLDRREKNLLISIKDSGEGIPADKIPFIFERYFQASNTNYKTKEGFGIGLAFVQEIINQHKAKIEVISVLHEGSEFIITIPIQNEASGELHQIDELIYSDEKRALYREIDENIAKDTPIININMEEHEGSSEGTKTVLIVEDHPEVREFIYDIVSTKYNVLTAANGHKALKVLDKEQVDLVITDLMMPWFDGFELLERLKEDEKLKKIPALVLSARTSEEDKTKVLSQGVNDFLCKPFNPDELLMRIENLLSMKDVWNNTSLDALIINNQETLDDIEQSLLKKIKHLILEKIDDPGLSINYLADQIAVSERKFYRMIKKLTGTTPFELIKETRLQLAHRMLTEKTIVNSSEVAKFIGIQNVTHFNTQFKKRFGKTPSEMI